MAANASFNGTDIGDYAWLTVSTVMPDVEIQIPRAQGIRQRDMGGGTQILTITAWVVKNTRALLEQYYEGLARSFGTGVATLTVNSVEYTNCKLQSIAPQDRYEDRVDYFTVVFKKSAMTQ